MAGNSAKKTAAKNRGLLRILLILFYGGALIYGWHRTTPLYVLYIGANVVSAGILAQLHSIASTGGDLEQKGVTTTLVDAQLWLSLTTMLAALSKWGWLLLLVIPGYIAFKIGVLVYPYAKQYFTRSQSQEAVPSQSKRQAKLEKRAKKAGVQ